MSSEPTVEECLAELREMFPSKWFQIKISFHLDRLWYWIAVYGKPRQGLGIESLSEAMNQVRQWHKENSNG